MRRRKGELSPARIDREFPHQIIVPCSLLSGGHYHFVRYFCDGLSAAPRGHSVVKDDEWHQVFCFRERADAELFRLRFGGAWFCGTASPGFAICEVRRFPRKTWCKS